MLQLILDTEEYNIELPESKRGGYTVTKEILSSAVQMISGRTVKEIRGEVWKINYQYGYFDQTDLSNLMACCDKGVNQPITCSFIPQENAEQFITARFWVESYQRPKFMWSAGGDPLWGDFSITLLGVNPID